MSAPAFAAELTRAWSAGAPDHGGCVFAGIPALARVDPEVFGLAACGVDGAVASAGDDTVALTLQSVSKPFAWAEALSRFGAAAVLERVGVEPSGDSFDSVIRLEEGTGRPFNPMVNAGALAIASLFVEADGAEAPRRLLAAFSRWAGRTLEVDLEVALSEREASHRNRAIVYLLRHHGIVRAAIDDVLDLYVMQCAILASARDLAAMAGTLANGGVHPLTGERVLDAAWVPRVLAVMTTCGLYDDSGWFAFEVGMPAKTGISGAVLAVAPGRCGLGALSPRLDSGSHSVRGLAAVRDLAATLSLSAFSATPNRAPILPSRDDLDAALLAGGRAAEGRVAPALASHLPDDGLGLVVVGVDGTVLTAGDLPPAVFLQATANPFSWLAVAAEVGLEALATKVGVEPTGNPYHEILLDRQHRLPANPLSNAGAITVCGLVPGATAADRLAWTTRTYGSWAATSGPLRVDAGVLAAERAFGDRNRAIASLLRAVGVLGDDQAALELYFQQHAIRLSLVDLGHMAALLAGGGVDHHGRRLVDADLIRRLLALLVTCGLHDESGRAAWEVGLPMKSGISGALIAVVPGVAGIAAFSPRVNRYGTPVRARATVANLAERCGWNVFRPSHNFSHPP